MKLMQREDALRIYVVGRELFACRPARVTAGHTSERMVRQVYDRRKVRVVKPAR